MLNAVLFLAMFHMDTDIRRMGDYPNVKRVVLVVECVPFNNDFA